MKNFALIVLAVAGSLALDSCNKCRRSDCAIREARSLFFLSKTDSTDLFLSGQYLLDSLSISPILIDTTMPGGNIGIQGYVNSLSYRVGIETDENTAGYIIRLDSLPPDTLLITLGRREGGECCPNGITFGALTLNGDSIFNDYTLQTIKVYK
jgi:hypothetical protein